MQYELIRARRYSVSMTVKDDGTVVVRAPYGMKEDKIDAFVASHMQWINKRRESAERRKERFPHLSPSEIKRVKDEAYAYFKRTTEKYAAQMKLFPKEISISYGKKTLGVCMPDNSIRYSYYLMFFPEKVREYVVIHELSHIKYKNHSPRFYSLIAKYMKDYRDAVRQMKN